MIKRRGFPKIYFGWWTVLAGGFLALWGHGYYSYGFSVLFKPLASELGFSRAVTSVPTAIGKFEGGFEGAVAGWITDRYGPKSIIAFGVLLVALGFILMNYIQSLWAFYVVWGIMLGTGMNFAVSIPLHTAITNWFVKKRGKALSVQWLLAGISGMLVLPLIAWLVTTQGWRMTCVIGGLVMGLIGLPLVWFCFKRHRPEYYGLLPDGATTESELAEDTGQMIDRGVKYAREVEEVEYTLRQSIKTPTYWLLVVVHSVHGLVMSAFHIHTIPFLTDIGIEPLKATGMMMVYIFASLPARVVAGLLADRIRKKHLRVLIGLAYVLQAAGFTVFLLHQTIPMIFLWFVLYGMGMGAGFAFTALEARYFGRKAFGSIHGSRMMLMAPFSMVAPIYLGWVYDTSGSYITAFIVFAATLAFAAVIMFFTPIPRPPVEVTDIRKIV